MTGTPPRATLTPDKSSYLDGDPVRVAVTVSDADSGSETIHGTDQLGRAVDETIARTDTAVVTAAHWTVSGDALTVTGLTVTGTAHYGAGQVAVTVRDAQGNEATATTSITIAAPLSTMMVGSDRDPIDMAMYPKLGYTRVYSPAGRGIKSIALIPPGVVPHVSFKDQPTASLVNNWLANLARPVILEWHHEPEGDMTIVAYRAGVAALIALVRAHPNGKYIKIAQTFTRYAQVHGKTGPDGLAAIWKAMWVTGSDLIGFDCEVDHTLPDYPDPKAFFAPLAAAAAAVGKPPIVPELGWPQAATDTDGSKLAAWYTACAAELHRIGCYAVAAYDTPQPPAATGNYLLTGKPLTAWQAASK